MNFATAMKNEACKTYTENGATAYNTTGNCVLDFFGSAGSLREAESSRIHTLFAEAYKEDPLLATKALFYTRDIRGGLGERETFRKILKYAACSMPKAIENNIPLIGFYGRYDDLYTLIDTPLENKMWEYVSQMLKFDEENMQRGNHNVSLLAKWLKTADASSEKTRKLGIYTAKKLGMSVYVYKRKIRALRKYIDIVERHMSTNDWDNIQYNTVPARAMTLYRKAFEKHDGERFYMFLKKVSTGEEKINAGTLYPYDIIEKYCKDGTYYSFGFDIIDEDPVLEEQWKALPNYVQPGTNAIVIADTSGSMVGRPINSAVGLAIYFAERNTGAYHNLWMSFSQDCKIQKLRGNSLAEKIRSIDTDHWHMDTNLEAAFKTILDIAVGNDIPNEEMVKSIIVISDMEINNCTGDSWSFYDEMRSRFNANGYEIPNVVFWNVNSRHDIFHADKDRKGVQLCSGQSTSTFKNLVNCIGMTPVEMMLAVLNSDRYNPISIAE